MLERMVHGEVPSKHHIAHRGDDGALLHEECITRKGFDGAYTIAYHRHRPHLHRPAPSVKHGFGSVIAAEEGAFLKRHFTPLPEVGAAPPWGLGTATGPPYAAAGFVGS